MVDRDRVNRGLHCCAHTDGDDCLDCPYNIDDSDCSAQMSMDVLELLKEQQAEIEQLRNDANARRCKNCKNKECCGRAGNVVCGIDGTPHRPDWFCADFDPSDEAVLRAFAENG